MTVSNFSAAGRDFVKGLLARADGSCGAVVSGGSSVFGLLLLLVIIISRGRGCGAVLGT